MRTIQTERLTIRNFEPDDWPSLREMVLQYQASEYAPYDHEWPTSEEAIRDAARMFSEGDSFFAVCLEDGAFMGFVSLNATGVKGEFGLGYCFNFDHHGKGYATEAGRAIIDHAFSELDAARIVTGTASANGPSCRLLARLGLKRTGQSTASFRQGPDGKPVEFAALSFAMSRDDWRESGPTTD